MIKEKDKYILVHKKPIFLFTFLRYSSAFTVLWCEIDQISINTFRYTTCCAANGCMFVYILIGAPITPLMKIVLSRIS